MAAWSESKYLCRVLVCCLGILCTVHSAKLCRHVRCSPSSAHRLVPSAVSQSPQALSVAGRWCRVQARLTLDAAGGLAGSPACGCLTLAATSSCRCPSILTLASGLSSHNGFEKQTTRTEAGLHARCMLHVEPRDPAVASKIAAVPTSFLALFAVVAGLAAVPEPVRRLRTRLSAPVAPALAMVPWT